MSATVRYILQGNPLSEDHGFRARVVTPRTATMDDVINHIVEQGSTVTRSDIQAVLEGYCKAVLHLLLEEGVRVNTLLANFSLGIKGSFVDEEDGFDPARHQVASNVNPGARLREAVSRPRRVERQRVPTGRYPNPLGYRDVLTGERNGRVTPGGVGKLTGDWLKVDLEDETQSVTFIAADGTRTPVTALAENCPTKLIFHVPPDLAPGEYRLRVRNAVGARNLHRDQDDVILTV